MGHIIGVIDNHSSRRPPSPLSATVISVSVSNYKTPAAARPQWVHRKKSSRAKASRKRPVNERCRHGHLRWRPRHGDRRPNLSFICDQLKNWNWSGSALFLRSPGLGAYYLLRKLVDAKSGTWTWKKLREEIRASSPHPNINTRSPDFGREQRQRFYSPCAASTAGLPAS